MSDTKHNTPANNKKFNTFSLTDIEGISYFFVRSLGKRTGFFNISKYEVLAKDSNTPKGYAGIIPDAAWFSDEEVADLVAEEEARNQRLQRIETLLKEWIDIRRSRSKSAKERLSLQKKEVIH